MFRLMGKIRIEFGNLLGEAVRACRKDCNGLIIISDTDNGLCGKISDSFGAVFPDYPVVVVKRDGYDAFRRSGGLKYYTIELDQIEVSNPPKSP